MRLPPVSAEEAVAGRVVGRAAAPRNRRAALELPPAARRSWAAAPVVARAAAAAARAVSPKTRRRTAANSLRDRLRFGIAPDASFFWLHASFTSADGFRSRAFFAQHKRFSSVARVVHPLHASFGCKLRNKRLLLSSTGF